MRSFKSWTKRPKLQLQRWDSWRKEGVATLQVGKELWGHEGWDSSVDMWTAFGGLLLILKLKGLGVQCSNASWCFRSGKLFQWYKSFRFFLLQLNRWLFLGSPHIDESQRVTSGFALVTRLRNIFWSWVVMWRAPCAWMSARLHACPAPWIN